MKLDKEFKTYANSGKKIKKYQLSKKFRFYWKRRMEFMEIYVSLEILRNIASFLSNISDTQNP